MMLHAAGILSKKGTLYDVKIKKTLPQKNGQIQIELFSGVLPASAAAVYLLFRNPYFTVAIYQFL